METSLRLTDAGDRRLSVLCCVGVFVLWYAEVSSGLSPGSAGDFVGFLKVMSFRGSDVCLDLIGFLFWKCVRFVLRWLVLIL